MKGDPMMKRLRHLVRGAVVLALAATGAVVVPSAAHAASCAHVSIQSMWSFKFVSVEIGNTGSFYAMLRARADTIGPWEKFYACYDDGSHQYTFRSEANNKYVEVNPNAGGNYLLMLSATADSGVPKPSRFIEVNGSSDVQSLKSDYTGSYVSAELGYTGGDYGMLRARAGVIGAWEGFQIHVISF
jgi:hypothetical protein